MHGLFLEVWWFGWEMDRWLELVGKMKVIASLEDGQGVMCDGRLECDRDERGWLTCHCAFGLSGMK